MRGSRNFRQGGGGGGGGGVQVNLTKKLLQPFTQVKWLISRKRSFFNVPEAVQHFQGGPTFSREGGGGGPIVYSL